MKRQTLASATALGVTLFLAATSMGLVSCSPRYTLQRALAAYDPAAGYPQLTLRSPQDGSVFPPEIAPCTFVWQDGEAKAEAWIILVEFASPARRLAFLSQQPEWTPEVGDWQTIKQQSLVAPATVSVLGWQQGSVPKIVSRGQIRIRTSRDPVEAPLFYREVNLPFMEAVKDPSRIRWRFGTIDSLQPPPVVLEHLPVCGNCHSFSQDGQVLGMDVDYANNKGSYVITRVGKQMALASSEIMTWDDYRKEDHQPTFGLLSQVSPDGQVVVSTVKDKSVFVAKPDLAFSQLFFPIKGILVVYHRNNGSFQALPGADDPAFVQSNPTWSPDGKYIVFARAPAYQLKSQTAQGKLLLTEDDCAEFVRDGKSFQFDLYRIPYNDGKGGKPEPLKGASQNGRSNFFAKYSPDGKWIVFCQAKNYMLLQPDSELFIIPAEGGEARRLAANTSRMNSWHSWSPNSRWLVFSSKANSAYTQLFLTHIDESGNSTPPVVLGRFTGPDRAANIPEFVNTQPGAIQRIKEQFLNDFSFARAGYVAENTGEIDQAIAQYQKALAVNPRNVHAHQRLGFLLYTAKHQFKEGLDHTFEALKLDPNDACAHYDLGLALQHQGKLDEAIGHLTDAARLVPEGLDRRYSPTEMWYSLGAAYSAKGQAQPAAEALAKSVSLDPKNAKAHYALAISQAALGLIAEPLAQCSIARGLESDIDVAPDLHFLLAVNYEKAGQFREALHSAERALQLAQAAGRTEVVQALGQRIAWYRQQSE